jgi:hypothetical protein
MSALVQKRTKLAKLICPLNAKGDIRGLSGIFNP